MTEGRSRCTPPLGRRGKERMFAGTAPSRSRLCAGPGMRQEGEATPRSRRVGRGGRPSGLGFPPGPRGPGREVRAPQRGWAGREASSGARTPVHGTHPRAGCGHAPRAMRAGEPVAASGPTPRRPRRGGDCRPGPRGPRAASCRDPVPGPNTPHLPASRESGEPSRRGRTRPIHDSAGDDCASSQCDKPRPWARSCTRGFQWG